jgi:hypothetical protein
MVVWAYMVYKKSVIGAPLSVHYHWGGNGDIIYLAEIARWGTLAEGIGEIRRARNAIH